ncbi:hypothetical protein CONCODRAFT_17847 [Conidiobolus coronatus NRRL 28638]|uniref:Xylanolytic transcriptional activator regulatory domain-containing protein n=1 Tax=Conidiobolus coronatus (strain ATCC 28846 / CBS 209.66 / NRRL 28638) TaxID=796925 RepID=A0A137P5E0_CONC2|nr:hypothetical protein CONCODRAFT_17847 [Conidiobolus coronatus NRRL 28638]|eukprot:KXN70169.1 hypothetical protein CONCODRAFT_17847 [Conidiobolus coronatus NRRL 28638]
MNFENSILQYQPCIKCNNGIAKIGTNYCKKCYIKPIKPSKKVVKKESNNKIYYYKFQNRDTKARLLLNNSELNIGYSLCIEPSISSTRGLQPIENNTLFLMPTWEQFRSLKEFATCIIRSDQISFPYFIISCNTVIQNHPKFQKFVRNREIDLPSSKAINSLILPYPLTSALQLLCQESFWDGLISIYFNEFHVMCPLFSIQSFSKKTASPALLSAIYFSAYNFSKHKSKEITDYMGKLAAQNIKKIVKNASIDNLRALVIHTFIAQLEGKLTLAKSLQAYLTRMSYLLGLHLECGKLSPIDRYNRNLLYCSVRAANIEFSGSYNFSPSYLTEFGKEELNLYDPKWQLPTRSSPIYFENQAENQLYSISLTIFSKFCDILIRTVHIRAFFNLETNYFNKIWRSKLNNLKTIFENTSKELEGLKVDFPEFGAKVDPFQTLAKMQYHDCVIDMYEMLKHKSKSLKPCEISAILEHCHGLYQAITAAQDYNPYFQFYAHIIGLHYLNIYPKCSESDKLRTKQRLKSLILFIKDKFFSYYSLNYLLLRTGIDALDDH